MVDDGWMMFRGGALSVSSVTGVFGVAAVAWVVVAREAEGMQSAPGTMGLGVLGFLGLWTVMTGAMMLPAWLLGVLYAGEGAGRRGAVSGLAGGYLAVWMLFGLVALVLKWLRWTLGRLVPVSGIVDRSRRFDRGWGIPVQPVGSIAASRCAARL